MTKTLDVILGVSGEGSKGRQRFRVAGALLRAGAALLVYAVWAWVRRR